MLRRLGILCVMASAGAPGGVAHAAPPGAERPAEDGATVAPMEDSFLDSDGNLTRFTPTYAAWFGEERGREPHILRALAEGGIWLGLGTAYYWARVDVNREDWDRPDLVSRLLFDAVRFDNNLGQTNYLLHPLGGAVYYGFSRVNNLGVLGSFAVAASLSTLWEYAFEWRELVSINDLIFTPFGGVAIGEFAYQLGEYLNSTGSSNWTPANYVATGALGWPRAIHAAIDDDPRPPPLPADNLGYSTAFSHDFVLGYSYARVRNDTRDRGAIHGAVAEADIIAMPGFQRPGRFAVTFDEGNFTQMKLRAALQSSGGWADVDVWFHSNLFGRYAQDVYLVEDRGIRGHGTLLALSTALRYSNHFLLEQRDEFAVSHMAGPSTSVWSRWGPWSTQVWANAHADFGSIRSLAYEVWADEFGTEGTKSSLQKQGYQFHLGGSARVGASVSYAGLQAVGYGGYGYYGALNGLDRKQEEITREPSGSEGIFEAGAYLGMGVPPFPVYARIGTERYERFSRFGDVRVHRWDQITGGVLGLRF